MDKGIYIIKVVRRHAAPGGTVGLPRAFYVMSETQETSERDLARRFTDRASAEVYARQFKERGRIVRCVKLYSSPKSLAPRAKLADVRPHRDGRWTRY